MDFLFEPNIAYLILLAGVVLVFAALLTPGTGLPEIGALFCLILAGYIAYHLSVNGWAVLVLALSIVPFIYSLRKPHREAFLGLSILLLVAGSVFLFSNSSHWIAVNPIVAVVASGFISGFLWLAARKSLEAAQIRPVHDLNALIGQVGEAREMIHEEGSVQLAGELWSARSNQVIPAGRLVRVLRREGFIVVVEEAHSDRKTGE